MSIRLTLARADLGVAEAAWKAHVQHCARCAHASREREWGLLCPAGAAGRGELRRSRAKAARERELDKAPMPGQETLW